MKRKGFPIVLIPVIILVSVILATVCLAYLYSFYILLVGGALPCEQLPDINHVNAVFAEHNGTVNRIMEVNPGHVWLVIDSERCPGKGEIGIYYATEANRAEIAGILGSDFFGVPYRMFNV